MNEAAALAFVDRALLFGASVMLFGFVCPDTRIVFGFAAGLLAALVVREM